jgi:hypothetical protein
MARLAMQSLLVVAALITAVPSVQALHPGTANTDLMEDDLTGSGCEVPTDVPSSRISKAAATLAVIWWQIAADLRSLAEVSQDPERVQELLKAADQYEEKARQIEASGEACEH